MADRNLRQRVSPDIQGKLLPVERTALTTPVKPLEQNPPRFHLEGLYRPEIKRLFQQAMQGDSNSVGNQLVQHWLDRLFSQGLRNMQEMGPPGDSDRATLSINVIAMFNLTTGYFLSQRALDSLNGGDIKSPDNIARQKSLLRKVIRAMLIS